MLKDFSPILCLLLLKILEEYKFIQQIKIHILIYSFENKQHISRFMYEICLLCNGHMSQANREDSNIAKW